MTTVAEWADQTGKSWAREWQRTDRSFAPLTEILIKRILARGAAHSILDVGCGAGELSLRLSHAKPGARVLGIDISPDLVEVAKARVPADARCAFALSDAATWQDDMFYPDLIVSRHGVMFFDNPVAAFTNLAEAAASGARLVFSCFRDLGDNPWAGDLARLLPEPPPFDPVAPGPFAFADPDRVGAILEGSGWTGVKAEPVDFTYVAGAGDDPVADAVAFFQAIGPAAAAIRALEGSARDKLLAGLAEIASARREGNEVRFPAAAWIVGAQLAK